MASAAFRAGRAFHAAALAAVARAPMAFFDTTPLGRVLARFAKDVDTIDDDVTKTVRSAALFCLPS